MQTIPQRKFLWEPNQTLIDNANVTRFMRAHDIPDAATLRQRSVENIEWFWEAALDDLGLEWHTPYSQLLDTRGGFPWARWFVDGELNIVHNCIDRHVVGKRAGQDAIVWEGEGGEQRTLTFAGLAAAVSQCANGLLELGVKSGDTIGLFMPMIPNVAVAMFACQKIGAIPIPIFSGYGTEALAVRLQSANVKVVLTVNGTLRRGKPVAVKTTVDAIAAQVPSLEHVVVVKHCDVDVPMQSGRDLWWDELIDRQDIQCDTVPVPAEHTALILYTSGTTGNPKGCVHTHAGCLAQMSKELGYHFDVKPSDRFFWFTDIGWMMGPWELIGALFHGSTVVMFEGAPNWPQPNRLWEVCTNHKVTHLGISPTAIRVLQKEGSSWVDTVGLSHLRILGSTGEAWDEQSYQWYFEHVGGRRCPVINISGGTELVGCLLAPLPIEPIKPCSLQGPGLGMDIDVFNEAGESVRGEIGYLVCKQPAPSMTKGFLGDQGRYLDTYFSKWDNVWNHSDWAYVDEDGQWFLQGRADDTLKVAGKRVGPSEIEAALMTYKAVAEAAAVGVPDVIKGEAIVCFVVLHDGVVPHTSLGSALMDVVAEKLGRPMRPQEIYFVSALPKTRSAKIVRGAIRKMYIGEEMGDVSSVENPDALLEIKRVLSA